MSLKQLAKAALPRSLHPSKLSRKRILRYSGGKVTSGPFAGMVHLTHDDDFIEPGMLLGSYEKELHPIIESWLAKPPTVFIDVGAAQGYYSIGFALRAQRARNIAFEMHQERIEQLERTATANHVTVELWGEATKTKLHAALSIASDTALICDVEGYEMDLLDGDVVSAMRHCRAIIETHDHFVPGVTGVLKQRFSRSHSIQTVALQPRTAKDLPFAVVDRWTLGAIDEGRSTPDQKWLILTPKEPA